MAYATYTTEALVSGSKWSNTSDRSYLLFTRELGVLWASARSVREEKSKQRQALQDCALVRVSLVRGKSGWRIGSVESHSHPFLAAKDRTSRAGVVALTRFVRRFLHGEVMHETLFDDIREGLEIVTSGAHSLSTETVIAVVEYRALVLLGYVAVNEEEKQSLLTPSLREVCQAVSPAELARISPRVEDAKTASHL